MRIHVGICGIKRGGLADKSREDPELERWSEYMGNYLATDDAGNIIFDTLPDVPLEGRGVRIWHVIYKKENKMYSIGLSMQLKPGSQNRKEYGRQQWSMSIYLLGDRLARGCAVRGGLAHREDPELPEYMGNYLATDDAGNIIFDTLPEAFAFGMFTSE